MLLARRDGVQRRQGDAATRAAIAFARRPSHRPRAGCADRGGATRRRRFGRRRAHGALRASARKAGQGSAEGDRVPRRGVPGASAEKLPDRRGHWTWINLWAAWCGPCKEEIPRLKSWEAKTASERVPLKVAFISIDDDARQLETFLGAQPPDGLRATYWLRDGQERLSWLKQADMDGDPSLPAHLLVDPAGKVRCQQQGAIDDSDFAEVLDILRNAHKP